MGTQVAKGRRYKGIFLSPDETIYSSLFGEIQDALESSHPDLDVKPWYRFRRPGDIPSGILAAIRDCNVVYADVTAENPSVYFELGVAHATGKALVLFAQKHAAVSSIYVISLRQIEYEVGASGRAIAEESKGQLHDKIVEATEEAIQLAEWSKRSSQYGDTTLILEDEDRITDGSELHHLDPVFIPSMKAFGTCEVVEEDAEGTPTRFRIVIEDTKEAILFDATRLTSRGIPKIFRPPRAQ